MPASIAVFEPRAFDRMQQVRSEGFVISDEEGEKFLNETIKNKLIEAREGLVPFQVVGHNCLQFVVDLVSGLVGKDRFKERVPDNHLYLDIFDEKIAHDATVKTIFKILRKLPAWLGNLAFWILKTIGGQYSSFKIKENGQERKITIARDSEFGRTHRIPLPSHFIASGSTNN